jgi:uncharacterized protein YecT (DUF1311 family)
MGEAAATDPVSSGDCARDPVLRSEWIEMPRLTLILIVAAVAANLPARAQHMNEQDSPRAGVVVTVDLTNCLAKATDMAETQLNAAYKNLRGKPAAADGQRLIATQRLWIQYRDANCTAERDLYDGGTAASPAYLACLEAMTRARTRELAVTYAVKLK